MVHHTSTHRPFVAFGAACVFVLMTAAAGCENGEPVKVGFVGNLTGRHSDLGVSGRNGALLAVEEVNRQGGIGGRTVELLVRDDEQNPDVALAVDRDLIDQGVVAIIGHMTSAMSRAVIDLINKENILMISPTTATSELSGLDDHFVRVMADSRASIERLAHHMVEEKGLRRIAVVFDTGNRAFSEEWFTVLAATVAADDGVKVMPFPSEFGRAERISAITETVLESEPDSVVVVAAGLDAALFCQRLRMKGANIPVFAPMWAMTDDFLTAGGRAIEGVTFVHWFHKDYESPGVEDFRRDFAKRFHVQPDFAAHFAFEAAGVLFEALRENDDPGQLKSTIISRRTFPGLQGDITIDRFGDVDRKIFLVTVHEGRFLPLE